MKNVYCLICASIFATSKTMRTQCYSSLHCLKKLSIESIHSQSKSRDISHWHKILNRIHNSDYRISWDMKNICDFVIEYGK